MKQLSLYSSLILITAVLLGTGWQNGMSGTSFLPSVHHQKNVTWLSGGVGEEEALAIRQVMTSYPLEIEFLGKTKYGNEYLANIPFKIADAHGNVILDTRSDGPFLLAKLPPGKYTATASYNGEIEHRTFNLTQGGHVREIFLWKKNNKEWGVFRHGKVLYGRIIF